VEVSPPFDHAGITAIAGAHVAVELICLWSSGNYWCNSKQSTGRRSVLRL